MTLNMFLSKERWSGGNVNEPQLSTSGFQMKEGQFTFQWTVISLLLLLLIDYYTVFCVCTIINKNIQLLKLNILVLPLFTNMIFEIGIKMFYIG
jgi:hypothetical protein